MRICTTPEEQDAELNSTAKWEGGRARKKARETCLSPPYTLGPPFLKSLLLNQARHLKQQITFIYFDIPESWEGNSSIQL